MSLFPVADPGIICLFVCFVVVGSFVVVVFFFFLPQVAGWLGDRSASHADNLVCHFLVGV